MNEIKAVWNVTFANGDAFIGSTDDDARAAELRSFLQKGPSRYEENTAPQPPAEAQAQGSGGLSDEIIDALDSLDDDADTLRATGDPAMSGRVRNARNVLHTAIFRSAPPSAPVGVESVVREALAEWEECKSPLAAQHAMFKIANDLRANEAERALAQQPAPIAPVGERELLDRISKLQAFKDYVHGRLDDAGIPANPGGQHSDAGCRVGDRLDIALAQQPAPPSAPAGVEFKRCPDDGSLVSEQGHRLAYGGVPGCWRVKPEDFPPEALALAPKTL